MNDQKKTDPDEVDLFIAFVLPKIRAEIARLDRLVWEGTIAKGDRVGVPLTQIRLAARKAEEAMAAGAEGALVNLTPADALALQAAIIQVALAAIVMAIEMGVQMAPPPEPEKVLH